MHGVARARRRVGAHSARRHQIGASLHSKSSHLTAARLCTRQSDVAVNEHKAVPAYTRHPRELPLTLEHEKACLKPLGVGQLDISRVGGRGNPEVATTAVADRVAELLSPTPRASLVALRICKLVRRHVLCRWNRNDQRICYRSIKRQRVDGKQL